jgi:hypothetical protein
MSVEVPFAVVHSWTLLFHGFLRAKCEVCALGGASLFEVRTLIDGQDRAIARYDLQATALEHAARLREFLIGRGWQHAHR